MFKTLMMIRDSSLLFLINLADTAKCRTRTPLFETFGFPDTTAENGLV